MPTNFTPQDAERLRELAGKAIHKVGRWCFDEEDAILDEGSEFGFSIAHFESAEDARYATLAANSIPAILDLVDALAKVARAADTLRRSGTAGVQIPIALLAIDETLKPFRAGGQYAEWLKQR